MAGWFATSVHDIRTLQASWATVRGGWRAARRDATELLLRRRILVDTRAMTSDGMQIVLLTRMRLNGDTQTDVLRRWLVTASPDAVKALTETHFQAVGAAVAGFAAAVSMERLGSRLVVVLAAVGGVYTGVERILMTPSGLLVHALLTDWSLLWAIGFTLTGVLARPVLRWLLVRKFRRGLSALPARK